MVTLVHNLRGSTSIPFFCVITLCYYIAMGKRQALQSERSELQPFLALFYLAFFLNLKVGLITLLYYGIYDDEMR